MKRESVNILTTVRILTLSLIFCSFFPFFTGGALMALRKQRRRRRLYVGGESGVNANPDLLILPTSVATSLHPFTRIGSEP